MKNENRISFMSIPLNKIDLPETGERTQTRLSEGLNTGCTGKAPANSGNRTCRYICGLQFGSDGALVPNQDRPICGFENGIWGSAAIPGR